MNPRKSLITITKDKECYVRVVTPNYKYTTSYNLFLISKYLKIVQYVNNGLTQNGGSPI